MTALCVGDSHVNRVKGFVGTSQPAALTFRIADSQDVHYFGISGGLINNNTHLRLISVAVSRFRPHHLIVFLGGNDLDTRAAEYDAECLISRLVAFLTQLKARFQLETVTVLSFIPRTSCRHVSPDIYKLRIQDANRLLRTHCKTSMIKFWKLHGLMNSVEDIFCDGVHLNPHGFHKLIRQL
jgi:lysophospholipase L1-like esterase